MDPVVSMHSIALRMAEIVLQDSVEEHRIPPMSPPAPRIHTVSGSSTGSNGISLTSSQRRSSSGSDESDEDIEEALYREIKAVQRRGTAVPPSRYVCYSCYVPGHYIADCPKKIAKSTVAPTPYQGSKQCFGIYHCHNCPNKWQSTQSWANCSQSCKKCGVPVMPKKQVDFAKVHLVAKRPIDIIRILPGQRQSNRCNICPRF